MEFLGNVCKWLEFGVDPKTSTKKKVIFLNNY